MKRHMRILVALLALALCAAAAGALAEGRIVTTGTVNLRRGPGLDYKSICTIGAGTRMSYSKTSKDDRGVTWYRVSYDGYNGWVSSMYASETTGGGGRVTTTSRAHLRSGAGTEYASRTVIDAGIALTYDRTQKDDGGVSWYHVTYGGKSGWVSSRVVRRGEGDISGRVVTVGDVHLRSGAGLDYASRGSVPMGTALDYDRTSRDDRDVLWYHVSYGGKSGWISSVYTRNGSAPAPEDRVTTTGSVHMRSGPGLDYASRVVIDEGVTLSYDRTSRDDRNVLWYHITYGGKSGWISSAYARRGGSWSGDTVVLTGSAHIRTGPGLEYSSLGAKSEGSTLSYKGASQVDDRGVRWYKVSYQGQSGWVSSRYARLR